MSWKHIDTQMLEYKNELRTDVKLDEMVAKKLATIIASEVRFLSSEQKDKLRVASPVELNNRLDELEAFQGFVDKIEKSEIARFPEVVRSRVIYQNYICFLYLPEACFLILRKEMPSDTATRKCAKFLTDNPVRSFRNALAHANWSYSRDFLGLDFWARKGAGAEEPLQKFYVDQRKLNFWQSLSRCVGNAVFSNL
ncbi:MAG: hypothetical protein OXI13_05050 [Gammaproteobacteria bacterium]|nr:hypothetical protein [Gammaproteobacteria bacterium]